MNPDLQRLIDLQRLDSAVHEAQRRLAEAPEREKALEARLDAARQQLAAAKERLADSQTARRAIEKEVAVHQGRLSKFREQAMAVKTNQEYHAVQHEITFVGGFKQGGPGRCWIRPGNSFGHEIHFAARPAGSAVPANAWPFADWIA